MSILSDILFQVPGVESVYNALPSYDSVASYFTPGSSYDAAAYAPTGDPYTDMLTGAMSYEPQDYWSLLTSPLQSQDAGFAITGDPTTDMLTGQMGIAPDGSQVAAGGGGNQDQKQEYSFWKDPRVLMGLLSAGMTLGTNLMGQESKEEDRKWQSDEAEKGRQASSAEKEKDRQFQAAESEKNRQASAANAAASRGAEAAIARRNAIIQAYLRAGDHIASILSQQTRQSNQGSNAFDRIIAAIR